LHSAITESAISVSDDASRDAKKKALTASGIGYAICGTTVLLDVQNGKQKQGPGLVNVAGQYAISALCLYQGQRNSGSKVIT